MESATASDVGVSPARELEVDSSDAIRLVLQFLRENRLFGAMRALQEESQVSLNAVESVDSLASDISHGRWDRVLQQTKALECSAAAMMDLYELVALDMMEAQERDVALQLLRNTPAMAAMKQTQPERYLRLEKQAQRAIFDPAEAYAGSNKQKRRDDVAQLFRNEVSTVEPSRLLVLLGQALKWQQLQGLVAPGEDFDLFRGGAKQKVVDRSEKVVRKSAGKIKFSKTSMPQCAQFSRDGRMLVTGAKDGFVEVWDFEKCKLRKDLEYQAKDEFMMHDVSVTAEAFSRDGELLATGSEDGKVKVWKVSTGICLRRYDNAHSQGIQSIMFSRDGTQLLTASFDHLVRIHGLKSGNTLKEFRGHQSYVNTAFFSSDGSKVISTSSDGTLKIWNAKTAECLQTVKPPSESYATEVDIVSALLAPNASGTGEDIIVCTRTSDMHRVSMGGEVLLTYKGDPFNDKKVGNFVACTLSMRGKWLYGVTDKGFIASFTAATGELETSMQICNADTFGIAHHPHRNIVATYGSDRYVRLWKA
ncbi:WD40 repeat-containing protein [Phytophthora fragariae]|uniref:WD40 repeat-containing protein SMU1 n=1 Tax=Phytophthora fragariae TaxID=53985 RepID=A0A6G0KKW6_9STRA|nr:WD40 repeat-containing protein [Phytophthora fragariae]